MPVFTRCLRILRTWAGFVTIAMIFAEVGLGHWVEDAIYLERIYWAHPEKLCGVKPVKALAKALRRLGGHVQVD